MRAYATRTRNPEPEIGTGKIANVVQALRGETDLPSRPDEELPLDLYGKLPHPAQEYIALKNMLLHLPTAVERGLADPGAVTPLSPSFLSFNALPFAFDPHAPEPKTWLGFLDSLWRDDRESIGALQEILGCLVAQDRRFQKLFFLLGPTRSGKGTICGVVRNIVGMHNVADIVLRELPDKFSREDLINRTVAIDDEARLSGQADMQAVGQALLSISGGVTCSIPRKNKVNWSGRVTAQFLLAGNELPRIGDSSSALAGRFLVLQTQRSFLNREDTELSNKLAAETQSIFNWALQGYARLKARGRFVQPASGAAAIETLGELTNPHLNFADQQCVFSDEEFVDYDSLFERWRLWCEAVNHKHVDSQAGFVDAFHRAFHDKLSRGDRSYVKVIDLKTGREKSERRRGFKGVALIKDHSLEGRKYPDRHTHSRRYS